jgi:hypothetical protein
MELALVSLGIKAMLTEPTENFLDMVYHVPENVIHKMLESHWGVGKVERHNVPFKRPITSPEGHFPFVAFGYLDKVIGMTKVNLGVDISFARCVE